MPTVLKRALRLSLLGAALSALAACTAPAPPTSSIDRIRIGDNALTCDQIKQQVAEMDAVVKKANGAAGDAAGSLGTALRSQPSRASARPSPVCLLWAAPS